MRPTTAAAEFVRVENETRRLRASFAAGELTEAELKARLEELMVQDGSGRWWTIGYETGQWYVHTDGGWVADRPPADVAPEAPAAGGGVVDVRAAAAAPDEWVAKLRAGAPGAVPAAGTAPAENATLALDRAGPRPDPARATATVAVPELLPGRHIWPLVLVLVGGWSLLQDGLSLFWLRSDFPFPLLLFIAGIGFGALTGLLLRSIEPSIGTKHIVVMTIGWALGFWPLSLHYWMSITGMGGSYAGSSILDFTLGGIVTALVLRRANPAIRWHVVALGWLAASAWTFIVSRM